MNRLTISLENCYGIKKLEGTLDFTAERIYALYAPNGFMKSSLAQVFDDVAKGAQSKDRIFPERVTKRSITDEAGAEIKADSVFVVGPYDPELENSGKTAVLLVDEKLRKLYQKLLAGVAQAKEALLASVREQAKSKRDFEVEISEAFTSAGDEFQNALYRIRKELQGQAEAPLKDIRYDIIFDDKVLEFIQSSDVRSAVAGYVQRYNELLGASTFFTKGTFDYYNAGQIAKSLTSNGFFTAKHTVMLRGGRTVEIRTQKELEKVIAEEKDVIIKDPSLRKQFDLVATQFQKNVTLRDFQSYLLENELLLPRLSNIKKLREDILKSYLKAHIHLYDTLMKEYDACDVRIKEIKAEAAKQRTQWEAVIAEFNNRFHVPFTLDVKNKLAVMLEDPATVELAFTYKDGAASKPVDKDSLIGSLSTGEKKALYVLDVIFHINTRKKENRETLVVVDDLADSFDYQNKYAILQYLKDISDDPLFKQIIMTHNFDFFRTIESRLAKRHKCFMALKTGDGVTLMGAQGVQNVFKRWKENFATDKKRKIGCIPFIRNLVEYTKGTADPVFVTLTSLLHWKPGSMQNYRGQLGSHL